MFTLYTKRVQVFLLLIVLIVLAGFVATPLSAQADSQQVTDEEKQMPDRVILDDSGTTTAPDSTEGESFEGSEYEILPLTNEDAMDISSFEEATLSENGSLYATGDDETINFTIGNDVIFVGGDLVINGDVTDNVVFAGSALEVNGDIKGDLMFAGGVLIINGDVSGDVRAFGGSIYINSDNIGGDLFIRGGITAVSSNSAIVGESDIMGWSVERSASDNPTSIDDVSNNAFPFGDSGLSSVLDGLTKGFAVFSIIWGILMMLGTILAGYFVLRVFPTFSEKTLSTMRSSAPTSILAGCLVMILGMFLAIMLLISLIGIQLLAVLALLGILAYVMGGFYARYEVGRILLSRFGYMKPGRFLALLTGVLLVDMVLLLLGLVSALSGLGWIIGTLLALWGMGAIVLNKYNALRSK
jgi:hypothetical protein